MTPWEWISTTTSLDSILTTLGVGTLAFLFARDLILTKGQHIRRILDLQEHHARELAEKNSRIEDLKDSNRDLTSAVLLERARADKATDAAASAADAVRDMNHVLDSLDIALKEAGRE